MIGPLVALLAVPAPELFGGGEAALWYSLAVFVLAGAVSGDRSAIYLAPGVFVLAAGVRISLGPETFLFSLEGLIAVTASAAGAALFVGFLAGTGLLLSNMADALVRRTTRPTGTNV